MDRVEVSGRTLDEALGAAASQLGAQALELDYEILSEPRRILGIIGTGQYVLRAWVREGDLSPAEEPLLEQASPEPTPAAALAKAGEGRPRQASQVLTPQQAAERARGITSQILDLMELGAEVAVEEAGEEALTLRIDHCDSRGLLIGHHGDTLDALQFIVAVAANQGVAGAGYRVTLDSGGYRDRQGENLRKIAQHHADEAVATGQEAVITGLKSYERRLIHMYLVDRDDVETYSEGEGARRQLVISPKSSPRGPEAPAEPREE